jgi:hypothetical protein
MSAYKCIGHTIGTVTARLLSTMVDGNIAAMAFNGVYDSWKRPPLSRKVTAILVGLSFPPFAFLFLSLGICNLFLAVVVSCAGCIVRLCRRPQ